MWRKIKCWLGLHELEAHPESRTAAEIGKLMAEAKDGFQVLGYIFAGTWLVDRKRCKHCPYDTAGKSGPCQTGD